MKKTNILIGLSLIFIALILIFMTNKKYEYMVIGFEAPEYGISKNKLLAYDDDEGVNTYTLEAIPYEKSLDLLGKHGWEVVTVTGAVGGDQQIILKRVKNIFYSINEKDKIEENKALRKEALESFLENYKKD